MADAKEKSFQEEKDASPKVHSKKEKAKYQAFKSEDDDSSCTEDVETSVPRPRKAKKERSNTFKVKIRGMKVKKREKEKKKKVKKNSGDEMMANDALPVHEKIFGVPLEVAVERSALPDKIALPRVIRESIQHIEETGLTTEGLYRVSGVKSKVDQLKQLYNEGRPVDLSGVDPCATASLLKLYLRELPSSILTARLAPIFDSCVGSEDSEEQFKVYSQLVNDLPCPNRTLLMWLFTHFDHILQKNSENKMSVQNLSIVFSPTMSICHGVLHIFFVHSKRLFPDTQLVKYIPLPATEEDDFPDTVDELQELLKNNEEVLSELHDRVNQGCQDTFVMEELWERQRKSTQIKRKIKVQTKLLKQKEENKTVKKNPDTTKTNQAEEVQTDDNMGVKLKDIAEKNKTVWSAELVISNKPKTDAVAKSPELTEPEQDVEQDATHEEDEGFTDSKIDSKPDDNCKEDYADVELKALLLEERRLQVENEELLNVGEHLQKKIQWERSEIERIQGQIAEHDRDKASATPSSTSSSQRSSPCSSLNNDLPEFGNEEDVSELELILADLEKENKKLLADGNNLVEKISDERNTIARIKAQIRLAENRPI